MPEGVNRFRVHIPTNAEEHIYGCGETYSKLDLKGELVRIWVAEHQNTRWISGKIIREKLQGKRPDKTLAFQKYESYYAQPTFVSDDKYFIHVDTNAYSEFDFRDSKEITLCLREPPRFTAGWGDSFEAVSENLSELLGRQKALPDWVYDGGILAIQEVPEAVDRKLKKAFAAGVEVNGVWCQDWSGCRRTGFGHQVMWNWRYGESLYPDLPGKIEEWSEDGVRFLGYINPFLAIEKDIYREAAQKGYCVKDREGRDYLVTITTFPAAMVDFTNPEAYRWYKDLIKENMIGIGMSGYCITHSDVGGYTTIMHMRRSKELPMRWERIPAQGWMSTVTGRSAPHSILAAVQPVRLRYSASVESRTENSAFS